MLKKRLIAVLILRNGQVIQSVQFKHTNVIHWNPVVAVDFFDRWAVDEIVVLDVSRSLDQRQKFCSAVKELAKKCFVPLTVGGWVRSFDEFHQLTRFGADKVVINTEAFRRPDLITECAKVFGNQCVVVSIDAKKDDAGNYRVFIDRGQERANISPAEWAEIAEEKGAGEILLNSIEHDGFRQGYDIPLMKSVVEIVDIPVIAMGGVFKWEHLVEGIEIGKVDAVAAANIFHYTEHSTKKAKNSMREAGIDVR
ncbi:MAG: imidazole glycerol phosphate synthase subunit HisF [candidate division Zixibacteria bacterium]|nr:imidazole glycerol phosphate synthase subunit HisF [Candidatus Tariuqbacter arcticus]